MPLTPSESVASLRRQYTRLREQGSDETNAIRMLAERHGLDREVVSHFCGTRAIVRGLAEARAA